MTVAADDVDLERDRRLVERCQAGDAAAFGDLYAIHHDRLVRHCARRLGGPAEAEDIAQEAFIRAWRAMDRFEAGRSFYCWLSVIASNACTDAVRRRRPTTSLTEVRGEAVPDGHRGVEEQLTAAFDAELADRALRQLTDRHRRVLHLREQLDWPVEDIAAHEGLAANAVDTLLWRARASLRRKFHALAEGTAAVFATGGSRLVLARNQTVLAVHRAGGSWGSQVRIRAAMAAVVVIGVGAAASPLGWSRTPVPVPAVSGGTSGAGATAGRSTAPAVVAPETAAASPGTPSTAPVPGAATSAGAPDGSVPGPPEPTVAAPGGGAGGTVLPVAGTVQLGPAPTGVLSATTADAVQAVMGTVGGTAGGATTAIPGTVSVAPIAPVIAPVVQSMGVTGAPAGSTMAVVGGPGGR